MRDLITAFHRAIDDVVSRFDGFVAQYLGDGVLVYFGYPRPMSMTRAGRARRPCDPDPSAR
jgi:class 3 adenylate cyclase